MHYHRVTLLRQGIRNHSPSDVTPMPTNSEYSSQDTANAAPAHEPTTNSSQTKPPGRTKRGLKDLDSHPTWETFDQYDRFSWVHPRHGVRITFNFVERSDGKNGGSWYASLGRSKQGRKGGTVYIGTRNTAPKNYNHKLDKLMRKAHP
jgi:hypothetical protein